MFDLYKPLDGTNPESLLARFREPIPFSRALHFAEPPEGGGGGGGGVDDPPADEPPAADPPADDEVAKYRAETERARKEAAKYRVDAKGKAEAEKKLAEAEKKLAELERAQMSDLEKLQADVAKLTEANQTLTTQLADKDAAITHADRIRLVLAANVTDPDLQDMVARKLGEAEAGANGDFDAGAWLKTYLEERPHYTGGEAPPTPTGGGHARPKGNSEVRKIKSEIEKLENTPFRTSDQEGLLLGLRQRLQRMEAKDAATGA